MRRTIGSISAVLAALAALVAVAAADEPKYPIVGVQAANPASRIRITEVSAYRSMARNYECLSFVNASDKTVSHIRFVIFYFDSSKKLTRSDFMGRTGPFAAGAEIDGPPNSRTMDPSRYPNCQTFEVPRVGMAFMVVAVDRVDYADGTSWVDATPAPSPTP